MEKVIKSLITNLIYMAKASQREQGVFRAAAVVYCAYGGFDATMAEETRNPSRDIPLGLIGSMSIITVIYCLMALLLTMMQTYTKIDVNAAYSIAFQSVGMKWAKYLVALGALKGLTTVLLVGALGQPRYITHIAPLFALVHPRTGTPIYATLLITIGSACIAFFSSLDVLASLVSVSTLFIFMMMAVALLVRRYYVSGISTRSDLSKLAIFMAVIVGASIGTSAYWAVTAPHGWVGYAISVPLWILGTMGLAIFVLQRRAPKKPIITPDQPFLSYAASGLSSLLSVFCYTEFVVEIPAAGGSFSYLRVELGDFIAFIAAGNILLES
ncbi:cationic amino acid transporter 5-like [Aristolochia californica]|uniref:cationic amino acid transporter 5-like n=1 Tax=Aristolochia californica TaxID=171875 RepID=UPI0035DE0A30